MEIAVCLATAWRFSFLRWLVASDIIVGEIIDHKINYWGLSLIVFPSPWLSSEKQRRGKNKPKKKKNSFANGGNSKTAGVKLVRLIKVKTPVLLYLSILAWFVYVYIFIVLWRLKKQKKWRMFSGCFSTHRSKKMIWPCVHVACRDVTRYDFTVIRVQGEIVIKMYFSWKYTVLHLNILYAGQKHVKSWLICFDWKPDGESFSHFFFCLNVNDSDNDFTCLGTNALVGSSNWSFWWRAPPLFNVIWPLISTTQWGCSVCQRVAF